MTFSLAQSPSNIFVFSVLHFTTYALLGIILNLSDLIHFLLLKKNPSETIFWATLLSALSRVWLQTSSIKHSLLSLQLQKLPPHLSDVSLEMAIRSWAQLQEKGDPVQSILLLPFCFQQLFACCSICDPVGGESSAPQAWLGQLLLSWRLEMLHPCSIFQGTWLVKSSSLGSACPRQQRGSLARCPWNVFPTAV